MPHTSKEWIILKLLVQIGLVAEDDNKLLVVMNLKEHKGILILLCPRHGPGGATQICPLHAVLYASNDLCLLLLANPLGGSG